MKINAKKLIDEAKKRASNLLFNLKELCFAPQYAFISAKARFKAAVCSRRAGKTIGIALDLIHTCINENNVICLYIAITTRSARSIIWSELKTYIEKYNIEVKTDETRLTIKFLKTGSEIRLGGAKDEVEIEKYRGWKLRKVYIDEAQYFRPYLTYFINDILMPALRDLRGDLAVTGTPGPVLSGPFYEITHNKMWDQHHWTAFDNPHMLDLELTLKEERDVKGITEDDPGYIRETYGKWIEDANSLVFKFDVHKNVYVELSDQDVRDMDFIFGIDIGYEDADAIAVLGYNRRSKHVFLVEEFIKNKMGISELVTHINRLKEKYKPVKMVMDAGALGKKIQEEIRTRHSLHIEAAEKVRKFEFIELLNDDLRTGKFKAKEGSRFQQDCFLVQWVWEQGKRKVSDNYHTDIGDAVLYAWRECKHFTYEDPKKKVHRDSNEFMDALEQQYAEAMERENNMDEFDETYDLNKDIDEH